MLSSLGKKNKTFYGIMNTTDLFEGSVIQNIRHLEELVKDLEVAANFIGNNELERKLSEARGRLKRGIVFAGSLYH